MAVITPGSIITLSSLSQSQEINQQQWTKGLTHAFYVGYSLADGVLETD